MSFRLRLTVLVAAAVAVAIVGASVVVYYTDRSQLMSQVDSDLSRTLSLPSLSAAYNGNGAAQAKIKQGLAHFGPIPTGSLQVIVPGTQKAVRVRVRRKIGGPILDVPTTRRFTTQTIAGQPSRVLTLASGAKTIQISSSLVEIERNLSHLRELLVLISLGGIGVAALLGAAVSRTAVAPLRRLTETTERIIDTGDLSERTGQRGRDEVSRLSARLDELLATLETSLRTQRQLVADASHELRTPIATLRANFEVLADPGALDAGERAEVLVDVRDELESITALVGELVELARGEELDVAPRDFRLDEVVQDAVDRAARRAPDLLFRTRLEPTVVTGVPGACRARRRESPRQCAQVESRRRGGRRCRARRSCRGPRPRARNRRRGSAARLQPVLPLCEGTRDAGRGPRPRDRQADRGRARRPGHGRRGSGRRRRAAAAAFTDSLARF